MLSFEQFSQQILETGDIDPDYLFYRNCRQALNDQAIFDLIHLKLCVYKTESELLIKFEGQQFEQVKYGAERNKAKRTASQTYRNLKRFHERCNVDQFRQLTRHKTYTAFNKLVTQIHGIGSWASWKYADILNKVLDFQIVFRPTDFVLGYEYPLKGLCLVNNVAENTAIYKNVEKFKQHIQHVEQRLAAIQNTYAGMFDPMNVSEYETLLCKYHSYQHKRYKPQDDLNKLRLLKNNPQLRQFHRFVP